ncbi:sensor domain-containing protein [Mangrovitalea sediminis]|uniref:sensor domain-containing protein n=1 Tax=Mangrovitalea sediminis TaxID=1982043 RepID=UPI000BE4EF46|nr:EAL domain-containing protein [Mangrovitalea sediminis]
MPRRALRWALGSIGVLLVAAAVWGSLKTPQLHSTLFSVAGTALMAGAFLSAQGRWRRRDGIAPPKFRMMVERAGDGIVMLEQGRIRYVNPAFATLLGYAPEELRDSHFAGLWGEGTSGPLSGEKLPEGNCDRMLQDKEGNVIPVQIRTSTVDLRGQTLTLVFVRDNREQRAVAEQVRSLNEYMDSIIDNADIWLNTLDDAGRIVIWNKAAERLSGYRREEVMGRSDIWAKLYPDEAYRNYVFSRAMDILKRGSVALDLVTTIRTKQGKQVTLSWNSRMLTRLGHETIGSIALARDVTLERRAEEELRLNASVFETADPLAITSPEGVFVRVNRAFCELFGYDADEVAGRSVHDLDREAASEKSPYEPVWLHLRSNDQWSGELLEHRRDGSELPVFLTVSTVRDEDGRITHYVSHWQDISERKAFEAQIQRQALYDPLTGLPNRRLALTRLEQELGRARRIRGFGALLFIDLDRFKQINDTHGHRIGDSLLTQIAQRIHDILRAEDMAARLGGDEFVVLLGAEPGTRDEAMARAIRVGEKILEAVRQSVSAGEFDISISASAGLALYPEDGMGAEHLLQKADSAMYHAKEGGRDTIHFFSDAVQAKAEYRRSLHNELRTALQDDALELYFQPLADDEGRLHSLEALVRWPHVESLRMPDEFIVVAEQTGLIVPVDNWVIREACRLLATWSKDPAVADDFSLMVNISAQYLLLPDFVQRIGMILDETGAPADRLVFDIDETTLHNDYPGLEAAMLNISQRGIRFAVDDFGAGYSSLAQLKRLPITAIKLNESFVAGMDQDDNCRAVVEATYNMAASLGLDVVAKGVETAEQLAALHGRRYRLFQGHHIRSPMPSGALDNVLKWGRVDGVEIAG